MRCSLLFPDCQTFGILVPFISEGKLCCTLSSYGGLKSSDAHALEALSRSCLNMASISTFDRNTAGSSDRLVSHLSRQIANFNGHAHRGLAQQLVSRSCDWDLSIPTTSETLKGLLDCYKGWQWLPKDTILRRGCWAGWIKGVTRVAGIS